MHNPLFRATVAPMAKEGSSTTLAKKFDASATAHFVAIEGLAS